MDSIVRLISGGEKLTIGPSDGKRTITEATNLFSSIDYDFKKLGTDVGKKTTTDTDVVVCELAMDATFAEIFTSLSSNVDKLILTQDQILQFIERFRKWLHPKGFGTFFLLQSGDRFLVVVVCRRSSDKLETDLRQFEDPLVCTAVHQYRIVVPQL